MSINTSFELITPPILLQAYHKLKMAVLRSSVKKQLIDYKRLHLACGNNILEGWANIDLVGNQHVICWDLTYRLPIQSGSIEFIFCEHFIEHVTLKQAKALVSDCYRVLQPNGVLRLSTPSLEIVIKEYLSGLTPGWYDAGWNPASRCQMVNEGLRLWGHQFIYDVLELRQVLEQAGYRKIYQVGWHESTNPELVNIECRPDHGEIIIEATK